MSKFISFIFFLIFLQLSWAQPTEESLWIPIDISRIEFNPQLQGLLYIGIQNVTQQAIQDGALPEGNYHVSQVIQAAENQGDFRFEVEVSDSQNNTATIVFFTYYDFSKGTFELTSYSVINDNEEDDYIALDPNVVDENAQIRGLLMLGVQNVTNQAIEDGALPDENYQLAGVNGIEQSRTDPNNYRFDVSLQNADSEEVRIVFVLLYDSENGIRVLSYTIEDDNNENGEGEGEFWEFSEGEYEGEEETLTNSAELPEGYQEIEFNEDDPESIVHRAGDAGFTAAVYRGYLDGTIPAGNWTAIEVHSVAKKVEDGVEYYRFDTGATDGVSTAARIIYIVTYVPALDEIDLYDYEITNVAKMI